MKPTLTTMLLAALVAGTVPAQEAKPAQSPPKAETQKKAKKPKVFKLGSPVDASLSLKDIDGKTHSFKDLRGKIVVINFWAYRCPAIKATQSRLSALHKVYKDKGVVVIGINSDRREVGPKPPVVKKTEDGKKAPKPFADVRRFIEDRKVPYPILADHGNVVADLFQARTTPHMFVLDKKGVVRYSGALDDDQRGRKGENATHYVRNAVDALLAGKEVTVKSTRPYGWGIKRVRKPRAGKRGWNGWQGN